MKWVVSFLTISALLAYGRLKAQTVATGQSYYERLLEAQTNYTAALKSGDSAEIAERSYILGKRYMSLGNHYLAKSYFLKALAIRQTYGSDEDLGKIYNHLFHQAHLLNNFPDADHFARLAAYYLNKDGTPLSMASRYTTLFTKQTVGLLASHKGIKTSYRASLDSAFIYADSVALATKILGSNFMEGAVYVSLAQVLIESGKLDQSIQYASKGLRILEKETPVPFHQFLGGYTFLAKAYLLKKDYYRSQIYLNKGLSIADTSKTIAYSQIKELHRLFANFYRQTKNWEQVDESMRKADYYQSLETRDNQKMALVGGELLHNHEQQQLKMIGQERELILQKQNVKTRTWLIIAISVFCLTSILGGALLYKLFQKYKILSQENAILLDEQNHRIKNNLQSVRDLLELQTMRITDPEALEALEQSMTRVEAIARVHKDLYDGGRQVNVSLSKFIPNLITGVLKTFNKQQVKIHYEIDEIWLNGELAVPFGLILNELVTNSCKYAFKHIENPQIKIICRKSAEQIHFVFEDNGPGFLPQQTQTLGLRLLELLTQKIKGNGGFKPAHNTLFDLTFLVENHKSTRTTIEAHL